MRKLATLMMLLMLAPLGTAAAQHTQATASPALSPAAKPRQLFSTVGDITTITIMLVGEGEIKVPVDLLGTAESPLPAASPTPTPTSRRTFTPGAVIPLETELMPWPTQTPSPTPRNSGSHIPPVKMEVEDALITDTSRSQATPTPTPVPQRAAPSVKLKPFLYLPFWIKDRPQLEVTEGDIYSQKESAVYGGKFLYHYALDISAPSGTPLYAPCEGYAVQGYHTYLLKDILYLGKAIGFGLGHFVEIECKTEDSEGREIEVRVALGHMREVSKDIPLVNWSKDEQGLYSPDGIYVQHIDKSKARKVKVGEFIGRVGISGMGWGVLESLTDIGTTSWDEYHVHIEVYLRTAKGSKDPAFRWDPFGWYKSVDTEKRYKEFTQSDQGLFLKDNYGRIRFATH